MDDPIDSIKSQVRSYHKELYSKLRHCNEIMADFKDEVNLLNDRTENLKLQMEHETKLKIDTTKILREMHPDVGDPRKSVAWDNGQKMAIEKVNSWFDENSEDLVGREIAPMPQRKSPIYLVDDKNGNDKNGNDKNGNDKKVNKHQNHENKSKTSSESKNKKIEKIQKTKKVEKGGRVPTEVINLIDSSDEDVKSVKSDSTGSARSWVAPPLKRIDLDLDDEIEKSLPSVRHPGPMPDINRSRTGNRSRSRSRSSSRSLSKSRSRNRSRSRSRKSRGRDKFRN